VWAEAPAKPYHTVTFNKNDGTGAFEKRIAVPTKTLYETNATEEGGGITAKEITVDGDKKTIYVTDNANNKKDGGLVFYEAYKIQAQDYGKNLIKQNEGDLIPVFTWDHYIEDAVWKDINDKTVDVNDANITYDGDTQLYHQWTANTFTVTFNLNRDDLVGDINEQTPLSNVDEALSAEGGLAKADKTLPVIEAELTKGEESNKVSYKFAGWYADSDGIQLVGNNTSLYPKDENTGEITLYAKWEINGYKHTFTYKGSAEAWIVPKTGTYRIAAYGAGRNAGGGGFGGNISGEINLTKDTTLYGYVGGQGVAALAMAGVSGPRDGGWNGGAKSGGSSTKGYNTGGGGNGASDVRAKNGAWDNADSLNSRIIVAGGGGGSGGGSSSYSGPAGNGGNGAAGGGNGTNTDPNNTASAGGGTLNNGGALSSGSTGNGVSGSLGKGGNGGRNLRGGGGGGGGYYGGAGGATINSSQNLTGGGGGSSWAAVGSGNAVNNLDFNEGTITPSEGVPGGGTNNGHGRVEINYVSDITEL
jgi:uncharacterized repeat protein (TIGR02543 family)